MVKLWVFFVEEGAGGHVLICILNLNDVRLNFKTFPNKNKAIEGRANAFKRTLFYRPTINVGKSLMLLKNSNYARFCNSWQILKLQYLGNK